jgi:3-oxoacyl-[acyl-carrier protein] reductase
MDLKLKNKIAFITGASRGIGAATARLLAKEGCDIFLGYNNRFEEAEKVAMEIRRMKRKVWLVKMDISNENEVGVAAEEIRNIISRIDILIVNAGFNIITPFERLQNEEWDRIIDVNLNGSFYVVNALKNSFNKGGSIVIISSAAAHTGAPHHMHYAAAKAGQINLTRSLAKAMAPDIRVNCIAPGLTKTDMGRNTINFLPASYLEKNLLAKRAANPLEIANVIAFLVSPLAGFIYGETININGGRDFR